jgi:hypothetical protein
MIGREVFMQIVITDLENVRIDGKTFSLVDAILNYRELAGEIQRALPAWDAERVSVINRLIETDRQRQSQLAEALAARKSADELTAAIARDRDFHASLETHHWALATKLKENNAPAAVALFREIRRLEIIAQRAALDAQETALKE